MTSKRLFLMLLFCTLISAQAFACTRTNASVQKVKNKTTSSSLAEQFDKIKVGMTEQAVIEIMGAEAQSGKYLAVRSRQSTCAGRATHDLSDHLP